MYHMHVMLKGVGIELDGMVHCLYVVSNVDM